MPSINRITLLGHLGRDPELKYTQDCGKYHLMKARMK